MAKSTIGLGQFRGKMGGVVFVVRNGQQVIRPYQPVVANPKSDDQRVQRAKAVLAGKLSHLITANLIVGMNGGNKSARRSAFNKSLLDSISSEISLPSGLAKAVLVPEKLILSQGEPVRAVEMTTSPVMKTEDGINVSWRDTEFVGNVRVICLVSFWDNATKAYVWRVFEKVVDTSDRQTTFSLPASWLGADSYGDAMAYAIPIIIDEENLRLNGTPLESRDAMARTAFIASLVATESSAISYGESFFLGSNSIIY